VVEAHTGLVVVGVGGGWWWNDGGIGGGICVEGGDLVGSVVVMVDVEEGERLVGWCGGLFLRWSQWLGRGCCPAWC